MDIIKAQFNKDNSILFSNKEMKNYFQMQFEFLSGSKANETIDFIAFYNYVDYPLPVSKQIFNTLSSSEGILDQSEFINGMIMIYNGAFQERLSFLLKLFDFDNDNIIHLEDIEFLIIHFHSTSNLTPFDEIINYFKGLMKEQKTFTHLEMKEIIESNSDIFYYFYISFFHRKPFEDSSISFYTQKKKKLDKTASGNLIKIPQECSKQGSNEMRSDYLPSEYLIEYFSCKETNTIENTDFNDLNAFEEDICAIKNTSQMKKVFRPFHGFKHNYSLSDSLTILQRKNSPQIKSSNNNGNVLTLFSNSNNLNQIEINETYEHMNAYVYNEETKSYYKAQVYIIGHDLYISNEKKITFISLKQTFIKSFVNSVPKQEISLESDDKIIVYFLTLMSNNTSRFLLFSIYFDTEDEVSLFKDLIIYATNHYNPFDYYEQIETIAQGSFGTVYKVKDRYTQQLYAEKVIPKPSESNFERMLSFKYETYISRLLVDISHPGIMKCYDIFEDDSSIYIIQEYYSEGNLQDYFNSFNQQLSVALVKEKLKELISSLQFMYKYGIVHRDLKMANILISNSKTVIIDFGLSTILSKFETINQRCGTIGYFAPEIIKRQHYNHSIDTWCLGVIGYYLFYGKFHYDKNHYQRSHSDILYTVINEEYSFPQRLPQRQQNCSEETNIIFVLMQCLEKEYKQRINITDIKL